LHTPAKSLGGGTHFVGLRLPETTHPFAPHEMFS
jgi:hypothetical protein